MYMYRYMCMYMHRAGLPKEGCPSTTPVAPVPSAAATAAALAATAAATAATAATAAAAAAAAVAPSRVIPLLLLNQSLCR